MEMQIRRRKWDSIGHTLRKPPSSLTRQVLTWNPQGKRKKGRPRNSWRWDTEAELHAYDLKPCRQSTEKHSLAKVVVFDVHLCRLIAITIKNLTIFANVYPIFPVWAISSYLLNMVHQSHYGSVD